MLQQICESIHNYFVMEKHDGQFTAAEGVISLPFLKDGQRFLIAGSVLNDGMYTYHTNGIKDDDDTAAVGLKDETWAGTICALAVPPTLIALSEEIKTWVANNGETVNSPYQNESVIGVYSYTKATGGSGAGGAVSWQDVYKSQLNRWRRVAF